jgi:hypothetical protein
VLFLAGISHLVLDLVSVDTVVPIGIPLLWPLSTSRWHSPLVLFPGIDRAAVFSARNAQEFLVEIALLLPGLLLLLRRGDARASVSASR